MAVVFANAAQAQTPSTFTANEYPAAIDATTTQKIGEEKEYFETIGRKLECEVAHFNGTLAGPNKDLTITPDYTDHTQGGNCRAGGTLITTVTEEGCTFTFTATEGTKVPNVSYNVGVDVVCPVGKVITVHVRNLLNTEDACTITIENGTMGGDLTGVNNGNHVDLSGTLQIPTIIHSNNTALCGVEKGTSKTVITNYVVKTPVTVTSTGKKISITD
jgi:hypothetical protein